MEEIFALLAGVLSGLFGITSQQEANAQNIALAKETREDQQQFSDEQAVKARQFSTQQYWDLHSPQSMVQQYKDAGLSPGLAYSGGVATGGGGMANQASAPTAQTPVVNPIFGQNGLNDMMNALKTITEAKNTDQNTEKQKKEIEQIEQDIKESNALIDKYEAEANNTRVSTANLELKNKLLENEKKISDATLDDTINIVKENYNLIKKNVDKCQEEIDILEIDKSKREKFLDAEIKKMNAEAKKYCADAILSKAEAKLANAKTNLTRSETNLNIKKREQIQQEIEEMEIKLGKLREHKWIGDSAGGLDKTINLAIEFGEEMSNTVKWIDETIDSAKKTASDFIKNHWVGGENGFFY